MPSSVRSQTHADADERAHHEITIWPHQMYAWFASGLLRRMSRWPAALITGLFVVTLGCSPSKDDTQQILGDWRPTEFPVTLHFPESHFNGRPINAANKVTFTDAGEWQATDGCNEYGGTYSVDEDGSDFQAATGLIAGVGCHGQVPLDSVLFYTDHIKFEEDGTLVLISGTDAVLLILAPA